MSPATRADRALGAALHGLVTLRAGPPGVIAIVQRGRNVIVESAGAASIGVRGAPQVNDHVRIASVSKAFSGAAALALTAHGKLALDDTVGQLLPSLPAAWAKVTLAELLNHTSGIPDYSASPGFKKAVMASPDLAPPPTQLLGYVEPEPLRFAPGSRFQYSNSDNIIVALMIQAVTDQPYASVLDEQVFKPLGLSQTSLPTSAAMPKPFVHGYAIEASGNKEDVSEVLAGGWAWASGGMVSTPADANRFVRGYVRGAITTPMIRHRQFQFVQGGSSDPPGPGVNSAGLAVFRYQTRCGTVYGHTGNTVGYTQFVAATGDGTRSVSVTVNAQISPTTDRQTFGDLRHVFTLAVCAAMAR